MLTWLRSRSPIGQTATGLYGSIVTQAREPAFYVAGGVPDTMEGRFGLLSLHIFLVLERIRMEGSAGQDLSRALVEAFNTDMDDNMREIGIGDTSVPRRVKKAAAALKEHVEAYRAAAAAADDGELARLLARTVYLGEGGGLGDGGGRPLRLARYMRQAATGLAAQPWSALGAGQVIFPTYD